MMRETTQTNELMTKMLERTGALLKMKAVHLDFVWLQEFTLKQITDACGRMSTHLAGACVVGGIFQKELIQNPA